MNATTKREQHAAAVTAACRIIEQSATAPGLEALARRVIEKGCLFTAVGADLGILARGSEQLAAKFRDSSAA